MSDSDSLLPPFAPGGAIPKISQAVDLALPSGTLWAPWNVGATAPDEAGAYFAWAETEARKLCYDWKNYKYGPRPTKYSAEDHKHILEPTDDPATANWGTQWMTPSAAQLEELRNECEWTWQTGQTPGFVVTSIANGLSIFLPAAGNRWKTEARFLGLDGNYWSANVRPDATEDSHFLFFFRDGCYLSSLNRCGGRSVRPVLAL